MKVDTMDVSPLLGVIIKHFTDRNSVLRWDVIETFGQATASSAARFIKTIWSRMPCAVKEIQVDGGSEFESIFEDACQRRGIRLFVLPPRSPKLHGGVERAHRTHTEEFYEATDNTFELAEIRQDLLEWERKYNTVRPHQSLGYLIPLEFLGQLNYRKEVRCH
jgi:transposase InsO family protein